MKIPKYARYDYCCKRACEFLEEFEISSYPIDIESIIAKQQWAITPYSLIMEQFHCSREHVIKCLGSKDGYTQLDSDNYSIAYNDDPYLGKRKLFTLMHEVGHIYLRHLENFDMTILNRGSLSKDENLILEYEANAFARNVLVPSSILLKSNEKNVWNISQTFGISYDAAKTRLNFLDKDNETFARLGLTNRMLKISESYLNNRTCTTCGACYSLSQIRNYCSICGKKNNFIYGDGKMKYPRLLTNKNEKLLVCPVCQNEETDIVGNFCQICGNHLVNVCSNTNCYTLLPSNARYCPVCGQKSTFFNRNYLKEWNYKEESDDTIFIPDPSFFDIPFE